MASTFERVNYSVVPGTNGETANLIAPILGNQKLVLGGISLVNAEEATGFICKIHVWRIPSGGVESEDTALVYDFPLQPGAIFEDLRGFVLVGGEGLAVGYVAQGDVRLVCHGWGDLETIT